MIIYNQDKHIRYYAPKKIISGSDDKNNIKSSNEERQLIALETTISQQVDSVKDNQYTCDKCGKSFKTKKIIRESQKKICDDCRQKENRNLIIRIIGVLILLIAGIWRVKFWDRFKFKRKESIFVIMIMGGILVALLSWSFIRTMFKWLIITAVSIAIFFFFIKVIISKKKTAATNSSTDDIEFLKRRINDLEREIEHLKAQNKQLAQKNDSLSKENSNLFEENIELGERIENQKFISRNPPQDSEASSKVERRDKKHLVNDTTIGSQRLYAEAIMDGVLMKVRDKIGDDTLFELELQNKNVASLNILPSVYQRILANIAYIDGCEKQITGNTTVKVTPGKAICNDQGKWIVLEKPVVFIS